MQSFMDDDFLLQTETARMLYHEHAAKMPILDYHCHLPPEDVARDRRFDNLGELWLGGDHYKWRAMRSNGIPERFITGDATWREKFQKWAETVPMTLRNPLYHWSHLELRRYFDIHTLINEKTADEIYDRASELLRQPGFSARNLMRKMNVRAVCTTDDPLDSLQSHRHVAEEGFEIAVRPTFRPDRLMNLQDSAAWSKLVDQLEACSGYTVTDAESFLEAVDRRHGFFHEQGCRISDHGIAFVPDAVADATQINAIFERARSGGCVEQEDQYRFQFWFLREVCRMNHRRGWAQQIHTGVFRNNNQRRFEQLGPDSGFDSVGDFRQGPGLARLLDALDQTGELARTVLYNIHPGDNELMVTLAGCFQDESCPGKIQFGSGWWFLDQKEGMEKQLNALSALGLLSRFVGMLTDSRSFLSYPRHEYFRRILCNLIGTDVERGEIPFDQDLLGQMVENISYNNARDYFRLG